MKTYISFHDLDSSNHGLKDQEYDQSPAIPKVGDFVDPGFGHHRQVKKVIFEYALNWVDVEIVVGNIE